jgi:hypothetical protein
MPVNGHPRYAHAAYSASRTIEGAAGLCRSHGARRSREAGTVAEMSGNEELHRAYFGLK